MKPYRLKAFAILAVCSMLSVAMQAQEEPAKKGHVQSDDVIVIHPKQHIDTKITIEINGDDVKVNGKPLADYKDGNLTITRRKDIRGYDSDMILRNKKHLAEKIELDNNQPEDLVLSDDMAPRSRFRIVPDGMSYGGNINSNRPLLGVVTEKMESVKGAAIKTVSDESAADKAGLKTGDIITGINDIKIANPEDLIKAIGKSNPGDKVTITYIRNKKEETTSAELGTKREAQAFSFGGPGMNYNFDRAPFPDFKSFEWMGKPRLGVKAQEMEDGKGIKVLEVDDESPAEKAGLKEGDIITVFDGVEVNTVEKLKELAKPALDKKGFTIKITRDGTSQELNVKIPKNLKTTDL